MDMTFNIRDGEFAMLFDREMAVQHLPTASYRCTWKVLRSDMYRFYYERAKLRALYGPAKAADIIKSTKPYPGIFLSRWAYVIYPVNVFLQCIHYLLHISDLRASFTNIWVSFVSAPRFARRHCRLYRGFREEWQAEMERLLADESRSGRIGSAAGIV